VGQQSPVLFEWTSEVRVNQRKPVKIEQDRELLVKAGIVQ